MNEQTKPLIRIGILVGVFVLAGLVTVVILTLLGPINGTVTSSCILRLGMDYTQIDLEGAVPANYTAVAVAGSTRLELACPSDHEAGSSTSNHIAMRCGLSDLTVSHIDQTLEEVTITISWQGGGKTQTFHPEYELWYPNGKGCPPERHKAFLTMHLP